MFTESSRVADAEEIAPVMGDAPRGYYDRKSHDPPLCTRCRDWTEAAEDSQLCQPHRDDARKIRRESAQRRREENRDRGLCAYCGKVKCETYACAGCAIRHNAVPTRTVDNAVGNEGEKWRADPVELRKGHHFVRFRGTGKRGGQGAAFVDEQDIVQIIATLERGRVALSYANGPEVAKLPREQRKNARRAADSILDLARRWIEDVLERHKYEP